jgi:predicted  nucleic acid-binding Zn-ribbon protein
MGIKAQNRGNEAIRRSFDKKEEVRAGRMIDAMNADMTRLQAENETLKAELERARSAYHRRNAEVEVLKEELHTIEAAHKSAHNLFVSCAQALADTRKGHQKLTAVMMTALTPEQYHDARARAAEAYPELFQKEDQ